MRLFARGGGTARRKERVSVVEGFVGEREGLGWVWERSWGRNFRRGFGIWRVVVGKGRSDVDIWILV